MNGLSNSGVSASKEKFDTTEVYKVGPYKQKGSLVEIYRSLTNSNQPFDTGCSEEYQSCRMLQN